MVKMSDPEKNGPFMKEFRRGPKKGKTIAEQNWAKMKEARESYDVVRTMNPDQLRRGGFLRIRRMLGE